jgi:hypothetical protein
VQTLIIYLFYLLSLALGKRLMSAGRRFQAMGQYGNGEVQRVGIIWELINMYISCCLISVM